MFVTTTGRLSSFLRLLARGPFAFLLPLVLVTVLSSCLGPSGGPGGTEGEGIQVSGRVLADDGKPLSGVAVRLARAGLADTTDSLGRYEIVGKTKVSKPKNGAVDTLAFSLEGRTLRLLALASWVASLPDVLIVQRDVSGTLLPSPVVLSRLEAVIWPDGAGPGDTLVKQLFHNTLMSSYSGFVYFPPDAPASFSVYVNAYGDSGRFTGRSATLAFDTLAGDLVLPAFGPGNALPVANAGRDTSLPTKSLLALHGTAVDSFGGTIAKWEWSVGGGAFRQTATGDTTITLPGMRDSAYACVLRVTDDHGNRALDTLFVTITNTPPTLTVFHDTAVGLSATLTLQASASDPDGIRRFFWDLNGDGSHDDTTATGSLTHTFTVAQATTHRVIVTVEDSAGSTNRDTAYVFSLSSGASWTQRTSGTAAALNAVTWTGSQFVAVGNTGTVLTSPDGITWTSRSTPTSTALFGVASNGTEILAVSGPGYPSDSALIVSTTGVTWTRRSLPGANATVQPIRWLEWGGVAYTGVRTFLNPVLSSANGVAWSQTAPGVSDPLPPVWTGTQYVTGRTTGSAGNDIATSTDGFSWTQASSVSYPSEATSLAWTGDRLAVLTRSGRTYTSPTGTTWTQVPLGKNGPLSYLSTGNDPIYKLRWTGDQLVFAGHQGVHVTADRGATWHTRPFASRINGLAWNGTRLVAVGAGGQIWTSP